MRLNEKDNLKQMFLVEIKQQCDLIIFNYNSLAYYLSIQFPSPAIQSSTHSILTHAALISKILKPDDRTKSKHPNSKTLADELIKELEIESDWHILNRDLRNSFDHFDERLYDWFSTSKKRNVVQGSVIPVSSIKGIDKGDIFKLYDPQKNSIYCMGKETELNKLIPEVQKIKIKLRNHPLLERHFAFETDY